MSFNDALKDAFDEIGGATPDNLARIVNAAREKLPQFSLPYLMTLFRGHIPRLQDREAVVYAFRSVRPGGAYGELATDDRQIARAMNLGSEHFKSHALVDEFVQHYSNTSFRNEDEADGDLLQVLKEFQKSQELRDEPTLFSLGNPND